MDILALAQSNVVTAYVWPILQFIIALGAVVFFHELGHFLVAKRVGIKVERFAIGMGPRVCGFHIGETDYCLCALPLGGYVKMLGQEDFAPLDESQRDPRAYNNKSVGTRFAVISAGVIMNVLLGAVLFVIVGLVGKDFPAPVIGRVVPGLPAASAKIVWQENAAAQSGPASPAEKSQPQISDNLQPGDDIVDIRGPSILLAMSDYKVATFDDVRMTAVLSDPREKYNFTVEREIHGRKFIGTAVMSAKPTELAPVFGIEPARNTVVAAPKDAVMAGPFEPNDRIESLDGRKIEHSWDIDEFEEGMGGGPVTVGVLRAGKSIEFHVQPTLSNSDTVEYLKDGTRIRGRIIDVDSANGALTIRQSDGNDRRVDANSLDRQFFNLLGMEPRVKVAGVDKDSPADKAGLKYGDIIVDYAERGTPTHSQLLQINKEVADHATGITILRGGDTVRLTITPRKHNDDVLLGIAVVPDMDNLVVAGITPGSTMSKTAMKPSSVVKDVNGIEVHNWAELYGQFKTLSGKDVRIDWNYGSKPAWAMLGKLNTNDFDPADYEFHVFNAVPFELLMVKIRKSNPLAAMAWGGKETTRMILSTYMGLRSLLKGNVSSKGAAGPVGLAAFAIEASRLGLINFIYFMAWISTVLAVMNFLPIPVVDGGHAVFLLIEKITGKPVPVKIMNYVQIAGMVLLGLVFLAVTWQDVLRLWKNHW